MKKISKRILFISVQYIIHLLLFWVALRISYYLRFEFLYTTTLIPPVKGIPGWEVYRDAVYIILFVWTIVAVFSKYYLRENNIYYDDFFITLKDVTITIGIVMAITFMYRDIEYSRLVIACTWFVSVILIFASRVISNNIEARLIKKLFGAHRIVILGKGKPVGYLKDYLKNKNKFKAYFYEKALHEKLLYRFLKRRKIDEVLVIRNDMGHEKLLKIASICDSLEIDFKFVPDVFELRMGELIIDQSFGMPMFYLKPTSLHGFNYYIKRSFDIVLSIIAISVFFVPLLIISVLIKIETKGSVLYLQNRVGFKSKKFLFYKFRTMIQGADQMMDQLKHLSERGGPVFKMKNDPRVTRIGKILRATSLDEIPQLINVLKGNMSIVGPRPQVLWEAEAYDETAKKRLNIMPGITGLWQVSGRASLSYEEMINLDLYYLENWSPGLDIKIILSTIPTILSRSGSY